MLTRFEHIVRCGLFLAVWVFLTVVTPFALVAAPYAAMVMDARTGEVLHSRNADTRLHPASLTKMMTLYIAFQAVERGEISLDTTVTIPRAAAAEPPSKLGLRSGQRIRLRYLIRAAAVKSANDAATAIGIAIEGSEAAFARRMNRTAEAMGMTRTTFRNAHGLTENGHLSTARDMTILGRHMIYDYPQYYNLFSRRSTDAGVTTVNNTNRRFLNAYRGADGIKTGYTSAAGFNLVASAERGNTRIIATMFGGTSTAARNARVAELLDMGFARAPSNAQFRPPTLGPINTGPAEVVIGSNQTAPGLAGKTIRVTGQVTTSLRPRSRPGEEAEEELLVADAGDIENTLSAVIEEVVAASADAPSIAPNEVTVAPVARPDAVLAAVTEVQVPLTQPSEPEVITRISTSGGRHWGINVGRYNTRYEAERILLRVALNEMATLDGSLRRVVQKNGAFDANFMGLSQETADLACRRLQARNMTCFMIGETG